MSGKLRWLWWLASFIPVSFWYLAGGLAVAGVQWLTRSWRLALMAGAALMLWGYAGDIYSAGWYDREAKIVQQTGKPAPRLKPTFTRTSPSSSLLGKIEKEVTCIRRPDPWPSC